MTKDQEETVSRDVDPVAQEVPATGTDVEPGGSVAGFIEAGAAGRIDWAKFWAFLLKGPSEGGES
jgi:hypothetical protein